MKIKLLCAGVLAAISSIAYAQQVDPDACIVTSDGEVYCFDQKTGANFDMGYIGIYLPGQSTPLVQLFNPMNPRSTPQDPYSPGDPYKPVLVASPTDPY